MNTVLSTPVDEQNHAHPPSSLDHRANVRTVSLADRAALQLGLALITWSRRPRTGARGTSRDDLLRRSRAETARATREREGQLALSLSQLRR
jgi:hypothetical protein